MSKTNPGFAAQSFEWGSPLETLWSISHVQHSASQKAKELHWEAESLVFKSSLHLILTMSVMFLVTYLASLSFIFLICKKMLLPPFLNTNMQRANKWGLKEDRRNINSDPGIGLSWAKGHAWSLPWAQGSVPTQEALLFYFNIPGMSKTSECTPFHNHIKHSRGFPQPLPFPSLEAFCLLQRVTVPINQKPTEPIQAAKALGFFIEMLGFLYCK